MSDSIPSDLEMVEDAAAIAWAVWRRTDFDRIDAARSLDDEFASRIGTAAYTGTVAQFLERLSTKWGVRSVSEHDDSVRATVRRYDSDGDPSAREFLRTVRNNKALVVLEMKNRYQTDADNSE